MTSNITCASTAKVHDIALQFMTVAGMIVIWCTNTQFMHEKRVKERYALIR